MRKTVTQFLGLFIALAIAAASFAVLFAPPLGQAQPVIGRDKYMHAGVSVALGAAARSQISDPLKAWAWAMAPGLAKEVYDARRGGTGFSVADLVADGIGAYVGVQLGGLLFSRHSITYTRSF
ncbi:hypothetical protein [Roseateles violae]|uniref:Lipoprotein n=1 Tax=Roseateles violae TaxID=3058042 RepID=A0ABT8DTI2_9BURK|nr:hypothetical protein [Pelomonas sp. PFR6]MDN3921502.1 hypothetical protein [Pelomonas sp. PFR6]